MQEMVVLGVPAALARDGWWMDDAAGTDGLGQGAARAVGTGMAGDGGDEGRSLKPVLGQGPGGAAAMLVLVALADWLMWDQAGPGLSLVLFLAALAVAVRGLSGPDARGGVRRARGGLALRPADMAVGLALLPLLERVQLLSLVFAIAGVLGYALHLQGAGIRGAGGLVWRGLPAGLRAGLAQALALSGVIGGRLPLGRAMRAVALPLGLGLMFAALLLDANPLLLDWASVLLEVDMDPARLLVRALFWAGFALMIWPVLALHRRPDLLAPLPRAAVALPAFSFGGVMNAGSVTSSLILFNLIFALQTGADVAVILGGAALPQGMSYAEYAHRGAYPLIATALLAGGFALISRPFAANSALLRGLLLLWIVQNVALVASALYRLDAYVAAYGLTLLRSYAAIWMAMVAVGLVLVAVAVWRGLPNGWLALRAAVLGAGVLYGCCFVNFAAIVTHHNLTAARSGTLTLDAAYLCGLGPDGWGVRRAFGLRCDPGYASDWEARPLDLARPRIKGWRDWSARSWRILQGV